MAPPSDSDKLVFKTLKQRDLQWSLGELKKQLSSKAVEVWDPHESRRARYRGFELRSLLELAYGKEWGDRDLLLFNCLDGYEASIGVSRIQKYDAYIAFASDGQKEFRVQNKEQNQDAVPLAPFYLIWDNIKNPELQKEAAYLWPYQIKKLNFVNGKKHFKAAAPAAEAPASVHEGFTLAKNYCMACHAVSGVGGKVWLDLTINPAFLGRFTEDQFLRWVLSPSQVKPGTRMPSLNKKLDEATRVEYAKKIYAYLGYKLQEKK